MNCVRTPDRVLAEWAAHGVTGIDAPAFIQEHMEVVLDRLGANTEMTAQNGTHQRMMAACDELGYEHRPIVRNASRDDEPMNCGYCSFGCQQGCKQSAMKTWLQDASDAGAQALPGCHADRVLHEDGRATGVAATVTHADGTTTAVTVEAPTVVVACGSVESPALLLRSGIGGPAVGKHLRLHPAYLVMGIYDDPVDGWDGQIQSALSDHFIDIEEECGFLIEATSVQPGLLGASMPWASGAAHKELMTTLRWQAPFITVARDHGSGEVVLDEHGRAVVRWGLEDDVDERLARRANVELARLQHAAGAERIFTLHADPLMWSRGEDFDAYLQAVETASYEPNDVACFTAHQMGSCRMGSDPATSVADGHGQLHDVSGVWIGDASAFPTAPGVNPMITIMSLAHRTAEAIAGLVAVGFFLESGAELIGEVRRLLRGVVEADEDAVALGRQPLADAHLERDPERRAAHVGDRARDGDLLVVVDGRAVVDVALGEDEAEAVALRVGRRVAAGRGGAGRRCARSRSSAGTPRC